MKAAAPIERIHHINHRFNRIFSVPLFIAAWLVMVLFLFLPYSARIFVALLINIFFNRPIVYLNILGRWVARPLQFVTMSLIYVVLFGTYALLSRPFRLRGRRFGARSGRWVSSAPATDAEEAPYQS